MIENITYHILEYPAFSVMFCMTIIFAIQAYYKGESTWPYWIMIIFFESALHKVMYQRDTYFETILDMIETFEKCKATIYSI